MSEELAHDYSAYTHGCRCDVCKQAKADYMRDRRRKARARSYLIQPVLGVKHGTRVGYEEGGCRCPDCLRARRFADHKYSAGRRSA